MTHAAGRPPLKTTSSLLAVGPVFLSSVAWSAVPEEHPRIWLHGERVAELQQKACRAPDGAPLQGCVTSAVWDGGNYSLKSWVDANMDYVADEIDGYALEVPPIANFAMVYQMTREASYCTAAIGKMLAVFDHPYVNGWSVQTNDYTARFLVPPAAYVFDWCYEVMSEQERGRFIARLDEWAGEIHSAVVNDRVWAAYDASNNYWYGYMLAMSALGYALYSHTDSGLTCTDYVKNEMVPAAYNETTNGLIDARYVQCFGGGNSCAGYDSNLRGHSGGGEWSEGNSYGTENTQFLFKTLTMIADAEGDDSLLSSFDMHDAFLMQMIHTVVPSLDHHVVAGEANHSDVDARCSIALMTAMDAANNSEASRYAAAFVEQFDGELGNCYYFPFKLHAFFLFGDDAHATLPLTQLPTTHYAEGMRILTHRSSWEPDALWLSMRFNGHYVDHTNNGQGGQFSVHKDGWLIVDHAKYTYDQDTYYNVLYLPPDGDTEMWWDEPVIEAREETADYLYYAADVSPVFSSASCGNRSCNVNLDQREFFFLKERYLVIYDRAETELASDPKIWQLFLPGEPASHTLDDTSDTISYHNGAAKLFVRTLLPAEPVQELTPVSYGPHGSYNDKRLRVTYPTDVTYNHFLHLLEFVDGDPAAMTVNELIVSTGGAMVGAYIDAAQPRIVMFSEDHSVVLGVDYTIAYSRSIEHMLIGFAGGQNYDVVAPGFSGSVVASGDGVLQFTTTGSGNVHVGEGSPVQDGGVADVVVVDAFVADAGVDASTADVVAAPDVVTTPDVVVIQDVVTAPDTVVVQDVVTAQDVVAVQDVVTSPDVATAPDSVQLDLVAHDSARTDVTRKDTGSVEPRPDAARQGDAAGRILLGGGCNCRSAADRVPVLFYLAVVVAVVGRRVYRVR